MTSTLNLITGGQMVQQEIFLDAIPLAAISFALKLK
jgi:hypothetical protein